MTRLKRVLLRRWHHLMALVGALAVLAALVVAVTTRDLASASLVALAGFLCIGLGLVLARLLDLQRQHKKLAQAVEATRRAAGRARPAPAPKPAPAAPPVNLDPVLTAAGLIRTDAEARHQELLRALTRMELLQEELGRLRSTVLDAAREQARESQDAVTGVVVSAADDLSATVTLGFEESLGEASALATLHGLLGPTTSMPTMGGFAVTPRSLLTLVDLVLRMDGPTVVECGSGTSTVWLALACARRGSGRVVALEHDEKYARYTRRHLEDAGLTEWAEVRSAPLEPFEIADETHEWYAAEAWQDLRDIDVFLVDGPPGRVGPWARYPALPLMGDRLREGAVVAVDDSDRPSEQATIKRWLKDPPGVELVRPEKHSRTTVFLAARTAQEEAASASAES